MALKTLLLRKKLDEKKSLLAKLREKDGDFQKREAEFETAIGEMDAGISEDDRKSIEEEVEKFTEEKTAHDKAKKDLETEIENIENEIQEEEKRAAECVDKKDKKERGMESNMEKRTKFYNMTLSERNAFFAREDVKSFIGQVRTCIREKRALSNVGLTIPEVMLELLKENVQKHSKLINKVVLRPVAGKARQRIMGTIPEAIWTEMCAKLNEMDLGFNDVEVDGYKVGGFFAVCNAVVEDNDVNLTTELLDALAIAIAKAIDKAIVYGKGTKMPLGIVTRLAQTAKPDNYSETAREWKDLHTSNILTGKGTTGINLFKEIIKNSAAAKDDYATNGMIWLMNKKTHTDLMVESMDKNLNAAIVAGINNSMPVIGGEIIELSFIPDGNIVFGYGELYLLVERAGTTLGQSEHVRFIEDQTVFKGTARYDGCPVIAESFGVMSITTEAPATTVTFPEDKANTASA